MRATDKAALHATLKMALDANGGVVPRDVIMRAAEGFKVDKRTIQRHIATVKADLTAAATGVVPNPTPGEHGTTVPAPVALPQVKLPWVATGQAWWADNHASTRVFAAVASADNLKQAWKRLQADGVVAVSYPQFTRQFSTHVPPAVAAGLRGDGREAYLKASIYCTDVQPHANRRWQADSQEVPVWVLDDHGGAPYKPWQVTFLDENTRMVMATFIVPTQPSAEDALATLAQGIHGFYTPDGVFVGGIPEAVKWDNGGEFVNELVATACLRLNIASYPAAPYSPWQKGKIERWHESIQAELFSTLPGASDGPKSFTGWQPWKGNDNQLLSLAALTVRVQEWVRHYNLERIHTELECAPIQAWLPQADGIVRAAPEQLHPLMLRAGLPRKVNKDGIKFDKQRWLSPALRKWRGRHVEVRYLPMQVGSIYVFDGDDYICEATPSSTLSPEERRAIVRQRGEDWKVIKDAQRAAAQQRREQAVIEAALDPDQAPAVTPNVAAGEAFTADPDALMALLGGDGGGDL